MLSCMWTRAHDHCQDLKMGYEVLTYHGDSNHSTRCVAINVQYMGAMVDNVQCFRLTIVEFGAI